MTKHYRTLGAVLAAFVLAAVGFALAGWLSRALGFADLSLPVEVGGAFLALSLGDAALARLSGHG